MEVIRTIVTVKDNEVEVTLPLRYNNKRVELIILPAGEEAPRPAGEETSKVAEKKADYSKHPGSLKSGLSAEEIDKQLKELRSEWDRDISQTPIS